MSVTIELFIYTYSGQILTQVSTTFFLRFVIIVFLECGHSVAAVRKPVVLMRLEIPADVQHCTNASNENGVHQSRELFLDVRFVFYNCNKFAMDFIAVVSLGFSVYEGLVFVCCSAEGAYGTRAINLITILTRYLNLKLPLHRCTNCM